MAYADGELSGNDRTIVETYVKQSPEAAARFAVFAATGRDLAEIFEQPMLEPVPQRLLDVLKAPVGMNSPSFRRAGENVIPFASRQPAARVPVFQRNLALAAACVTMLAVGAGSYWFLNGPAGSTGETFALAHSAAGTTIAAAELASALDTVPANAIAVRTISGTAASIKPVFTFATASKDFCRQYEITREHADPISGVACRENTGQWRIETHVAVEASRVKDGEIKTAGKADVAAVEATVDKLISGDVLGSDEEAVLLKNSWKAAAP
jgi:hypothetical protein